MPKLVNHNDHAVRVRDENGRPVRLRSGQVLEADGATADALSGIEGVESANKADEDAYADSQASGVEGDPQESDTAIEIYAVTRSLGKKLLVALPLQRVVGDDAAPYGPPTGTVTTKQALAAESDENRRRFADHERLPEDADNEGLQAQSTVESDQAEAVVALEEAAQQLADAHEEGKADRDEAKAERKSAKKSAKTEE